MAVPWIDGAVAIVFITAWTLFWKFALDVFWALFGEEYIYLQSLLEGETDDRSNVER